MSEKITIEVDGFELDVNMNYVLTRQTIYDALKREKESWEESYELFNKSSKTYSATASAYCQGRIESAEALMEWVKTVL